MVSKLPINLDDLLRRQGVESARAEFKASWDEKTTGPQVVRTICAYANDFQNLNGGYIVIGIEELDGRAVLPPKGLSDSDIEQAQKWIRGRCNAIDPVYQPVMAPEEFQERKILVVWAPGSQTRPHQAPESADKGAPRKYYIRLGSETIDASRQPDLFTQLMQLTARVPFDDRLALHAEMSDIRETKVKEFLHDIGSGLIEEPNTRTLYRNLGIADPVNGHDAPRNVGLLFFSQNPEKWFPGARIEVVHFTNDASGDSLPEVIFNNRPIHEQLRECVTYLENLTIRMIQKLPGQSLAGHWVGYPSRAVREALVNAVYHRAYDGVQEPIKVYLYPDRLEIISYPGPVPGIELKHLDGLASLPPVPARNRRIGEFLKELKLAEGRGTGIPTVLRMMKQNGSPPPRFDFDETRSYFRVTLPVHPEYKSILALQDVAHLKAIGDTQGAAERLHEAHAADPGALGLALELTRDLVLKSDIHGAEEVYRRVVAKNPSVSPAPLITLIASAMLDANRRQEALKWLDMLPKLDTIGDAFEAAIQEKRAARPEHAHRYFLIAGDAVRADVRALHEFAQVKIILATKAHRSRSSQPSANRRLLDEAREMLERVVQLEAPPTRHAWAWYDLARVLKWQRVSRSEVNHALEKAIQLDPAQPRFKDELLKFSEDR